MTSIARQAFVRHEGESDRALFERMAHDASFLYACKPLKPLDHYDTSTETVFLNQGVVVRSRTSGGYTMIRDADKAREVGGDLLKISFTEANHFGLSAPMSAPRTWVTAGGVIVIDLSQTFQLQVTDHRHTVLLVSRARLTEQWGSASPHGLVIDRDHPLAPVLGDMAQRLADLGSVGTPLQADALLRGLLNLLNDVIAERIAERRSVLRSAPGSMA